MGIFDKTMEDTFFKGAREYLQMSEEELSSFLEISHEDYLKIKPLGSHFFNHQDYEESLVKLIKKSERVLRPLWSFKTHHLTKEDVLKEYSRVDSKTNKTLKELLMADDDYYSEESKRGREIIEKKCFYYFEHYEIGDGASELSKINVRISKEFLRYQVKIKETTIYEDHGGEYEILEPKQFNTQLKYWEVLPKYSSSIEEAWKLVEILAAKGVQIRLSNKSMGNQYWWCYLSSEPDSDRPDVVAQGNSGPEAICLAILDYVNKK